MKTPTNKRINAAIDRQHPHAGVLVLDARGGAGKPRQVGYRQRNPEAADNVMDQIVVMNAPPVSDPRARDERGGIIGSGARKLYE